MVTANLWYVELEPVINQIYPSRSSHGAQVKFLRIYVNLVISSTPSDLFRLLVQGHTYTDILTGVFCTQRHTDAVSYTRGYTQK